MCRQLQIAVESELTRTLQSPCSITTYTYIVADEEFISLISSVADDDFISYINSCYFNFQSKTYLNHIKSSLVEEKLVGLAVGSS